MIFDNPQAAQKQQERKICNRNGLSEENLAAAEKAWAEFGKTEVKANGSNLSNQGFSRRSFVIGYLYAMKENGR